MRHQTFTWKADSIVKETADTITIRFNTNNHPFFYKPGQFINLKQVIQGKEVFRSYSLSSSPVSGEKPAITIKRIEGGLMSDYIVEKADSIREWQIEGPHGAFFVDPHQMGNRPIVLIGGGSGITPLYSILKSVLQQSNANVFLIDCNRTWKDVVFAEDLNYLEQVHEERFKVQHFLSREDVGIELPCKNYRTEKMNKLFLKKRIKQWLGEQVLAAEYFFCGPTTLINMCMDTVLSLGVASSQIHQEYFLPVEEESSGIELPKTSKEVLLHFFEQTNLLEVQPGSTILEAALTDKIPLSYSCKPPQGTCGRCTAKRISGTVHMKQNFALTEEQVKKGFILLCQTYALDNEVVINVA